MEEKIQHYLQQIEEEKNINILLACETGSRAWGFPSPDSDYDIRIIYVHKRDWYLSLYEQKDSIERMFENNDLDITGWDLKKALNLLRKSNAPLLERIQSPILYRCDSGFLEGINNLATQEYSKIATMHHYLSMSKKFIDELKVKENYKLKKFFYALRSATACKWILERNEIPPIEFKKMLAGLDIDKNLLIRIDELITLKATISEGYVHSGEKELFNFIEKSIETAEGKRNSLPSSKGKSEVMDNFFIKMIEKYDH